MKILKINLKNPQREIVRKAIKVLRKGRVIVYPTETTYGLGCDVSSKKAVQKIFKIKKRSLSKPLSIIMSSFRMAQDYIDFDKISWRLAKKYWPGPLTIVLPSKCQKKQKLYPDLTQRSTLGVRISSNRLVIKLIKELGRPLISTSANISGQRECYNLAEILKQFKNKKNQPDLILDAGSLPRIKPSTVVGISGGRLKVWRQGPIKI